MRILFAFLTPLLLATSLYSAEVTLEQSPESVKATIGDDVFLVFQFDKNRRKPFALPVTGPGGFELLKSAKASEEEGAAGRKVIIADESPKLKGGKADFKIGDEVEVGKIEEDWLEIPAKKLWIHRSSVAPMVSTVTRQINDNPTKGLDRKHPLYYDHPHHKGIWLSVDEIEGIKFWNEDGEIKNQSVEIVKKSGNPAVLKTVNHWVGTDGKTLLKEETTISVYANRLLSYDVTFTAPEQNVNIRDTKEGMFGIRLPNSMREMIAGGPVTNAEGAEGTAATWGRTTNWIDYKGPVDGHVFGVTIMDHPQNPWKSRYHVRNYGLFSINPFGAGAYTKGRDDEQPAHHRVLKPNGEKLNFKYGLYVHGGETTPDDINKVFKQFAKAK